METLILEEERGGDGNSNKIVLERVEIYNECG